MNIITISKRGTMKLPKDILAELNGAKHFILRVTASGISLTPVQIQAAVDFKAIPPEKPTVSK
jgi:hypothetical protein